MKLKALIVDEDYPARQKLRQTLSGFDKVEIVGEAAGSDEALSLLKALDYQIVFMETTMNGTNGLELARAIHDLENKPYIVFVTAYAEYAVSAFAVEAADYLLKPVTKPDLNRAVDKVYRMVREQSMLLKITSAPKEGKGAVEARTVARRHNPGSTWTIDRIPAGRQGKTILVTESDIFYAFTLQDGVYIKTETERLFTRLTLKELETRLNQYCFFRSHRCYLVNLNKVKEIIPFFNGTYNLIVADKEKSEVPVSRAQAKRLRKILGI